MYTLMAHLYQRSQAREAFHSFRLKALIGSIGSELFRGKNRLQDFGEQKGKIYPTPKYMGVQEIPLDQIAGSVGRKDDFDNQFRPLKDHLRERWVNVYLRLQVEDLPAIQVYQVGDRYFVEDGHHRVSAARYIGRKFIQAEVWLYGEHASCNSCCPAIKMESRAFNV